MHLAVKLYPAFLLPLFPALALAAEPSRIALTVSQIPAGATEVVALIDVVAPPPAPDYPDPAAPAPTPAPVVPPPDAKAASPAAPKGEPGPAAKGDQPRGRRGRRGMNAAPVFSPMRRAVVPSGANSVSLDVPVPAGENYQVRVVALRGSNPFPPVVAGGRASAIKVSAETSAPIAIALTAPQLKLSPKNPASVAPGAHYTLAGTLTDAAGSLGQKNRMRVWMSVGTPPRENFAGAQVSTIDVKADGDDVTFSIALTAPAEPTTLYFQFGEVPNDFARADGTQAAYLVLPNLAAGEAPLTLRVQ